MKRIDLPTCDDRPLWDLILGPYLFPCVAAADELGVFASLAQTPGTLTEFAERHRLGQRGAEVLLGVLAAAGFLVQNSGRFYLSELARNYLLPDSPYYYGPYLRMNREVQVTWTMVREVLLRDAPANISGDGIKLDDGLTGFWDTKAPDVAFLQTFTKAMHSHALPAAMGVAARGDFSGVHHVLDVAGGSGCYSIALALRHPELRFTLMDLAPVCDCAREYIGAYDLDARIATRPFDMFSSDWPGDHDAVFFSDVFHDWDVPRCQHLVRQSFASLPRGGRIYLHEVLLNDTKDGPPMATIYSLAMLLATTGKQRTYAELGGLLSDGGFVDVAVAPGYGNFSLITARKP